MVFVSEVVGSILIILKSNKNNKFKYYRRRLKVYWEGSLNVIFCQIGLNEYFQLYCNLYVFNIEFWKIVLEYYEFKCFYFVYYIKRRFFYFFGKFVLGMVNLYLVS